MNISFSEGKFGKNDKIIHVTTIPSEKITIFKLALLVNQLAWNELELKEGRGRRFAQRPGGKETMLFRKAMLWAVDSAIDGVNFAEAHNKDKVVLGAKELYLRPEAIETTLKRTFQEGLGGYCE